MWRRNHIIMVDNPTDNCFIRKSYKHGGDLHGCVWDWTKETGHQSFPTLNINYSQTMPVPGHRTPVPQPADLTNHHTIRSLTIQLRGVVQSVKRVNRHIHAYAAYTFQHQTRDTQKWIFGNWLFLDSTHTCLLCAMHLSTSIRCTHENVITNTSASWSCKVHLSPTSKLPTIRLFGVVLSIVDYVWVFEYT